MHTKITNGTEAVSKILSGIKKISEPVIMSLGPNGSNTIIQKGEGEPLITNDGVTIARNVRLEDAEERQAADAVIQAALRTNFEAGDGTSTTIALIKELFEQLYMDKDKYKNIKMLTRLSNDFRAFIEKRAEKTTMKDLNNIALVSCQNENVSGLVVEAFDKLGANAVVNISESLSTTSLSIEKGLGIDSGYANTLFCNDIKARRIVYDQKCLVFTTHSEINDVEKIIPIIKYAFEKKAPLIIAAYGFSPAVLGVLHTNMTQVPMSIAPIEITGTKKDQDDALFDIELVLNSQDFTDAVFGNFKISQCNSFNATLTNSTFGVPEFNESTEKNIEALRAQIDNQLKENDSSDIYKDRLMKRRARLDCGFAVLMIGGDTRAEVQELRLRAEDAVMACRSALEMGHVIGGGWAFKEFCEINDVPEELEEAFLNVYNHIQKNIYESDRFDAIDPAKVLVCAVKNAISITKTLLSANSIITRNEQ